MQHFHPHQFILGDDAGSDMLMSWGTPFDGSFDPGWQA